MLTRIGQEDLGRPYYELDLAALYTSSSDRARFERRWPLFLSSTPDHLAIFVRNGHRIVYKSESYWPQVVDNRPPILLMFGNPASQSIRAGMCFAHEGQVGREHRLWKALSTVGWLTFRDATNSDADVDNSIRRPQLLQADYESPFRIAIDVLYTFPTPASAPSWAGVAGLVRLFGRAAAQRIAQCERTRLEHSIATGITNRGAVVAFQKDAYETLREESAPAYSADAARSGALSSASALGVPVPLVGVPPTRFAHTSAFRDRLRAHGEQFMAISRQHCG